MSILDLQGMKQPQKANAPQRSGASKQCGGGGGGGGGGGCSCLSLLIC